MSQACPILITLQTCSMLTTSQTCLILTASQTCFILTMSQTCPILTTSQTCPILKRDQLQVPLRNQQTSGCQPSTMPISATNFRRTRPSRTSGPSSRSSHEASASGNRISGCRSRPRILDPQIGWTGMEEVQLRAHRGGQKDENGESAFLESFAF